MADMQEPAIICRHWQSLLWRGKYPPRRRAARGARQNLVVNSVTNRARRARRDGRFPRAARAARYSHRGAAAREVPPEQVAHEFEPFLSQFN
jgi:hypothetical protein